ncbi:MAG: hypothetical protein LBV02_05315 [Bacteroidales bacterium]|jgi:DNA-binding CsgD family transcriptional regulator|nr:hypothetical protein [Bacteroidales bacterium]
MKKTKFEEFKKLKSQGVQRLEIIEKLGISPRSFHNYNKLLNRHKTDINIPFYVVDYFLLYLTGGVRQKGFGVIPGIEEGTTKADIAEVLGVTEKTLLVNEKKYLLKDFALWLRLYGFPYHEIRKTLRIKSRDEVGIYLTGVVVPNDIISQIKTLSEYAGFNPYEVELSESILEDLKKAEDLLTGINEKLKSSSLFFDHSANSHINPNTFIDGFNY